MAFGERCRDIYAEGVRVLPRTVHGRRQLRKSSRKSGRGDLFPVPDRTLFSKLILWNKLPPRFIFNWKPLWAPLNEFCAQTGCSNHLHCLKWFHNPVLVTGLITYLLAYLLAPWSRVLLEKLTGFQLVKKFPVFCGNRRFVTAFTSARQLSLSWASSNQSMPPHPTSCRSILILSSHLRLSNPATVFKILLCKINMRRTSQT